MFEFVIYIGDMLSSFSWSDCRPEGINKDPNFWLDEARPNLRYVLKKI